jgi:glycosyltransferase involved in cell wall biosynthesis
MISLLLTTYNRKQQLENSLKRLQALTKPDEIVVVDDGNDGTEEMLKQFKDTLPPITYVQRNMGYYDICGISRNIGIKLCKGDTIFIADPEMLFITDVISQMEHRASEMENPVITAGIVYRTKIYTPIQRYISDDPRHFLETSKVETHPEDAGDNMTITKTVNWSASYIVRYKKDWLMEIGGYDENMSVKRGGGGYGYDDVDLLTRLQISGYHQFVDNTIEAIHQYHEPHDSGTDSGDINFKIFKDKKLDIWADRGNPDRIANKDREWGVL